jgi:hypothetical protein
MARRLIFGCGLLLCAVVASCSDGTGPAESLVIAVSPDTVHINGVVPVPVGYTERYAAAGQSKIWIAPIDLETEVAAGKWGPSVDPNNLYLQAALGDAQWIAVTNGDFGGAKTFWVPWVAGRYRLRQRFQMTAQNATTGSGEVYVATSNVFVVASP